MTNKNRKLLDSIESKTKIYLVIIAIILIVLCVYKPIFIVPAIVIYVLLIAYTIWVYNKRKGEISSYVEELTISMDSAAKNTLINSPFPIIILETDGNVIWRSSKFNKEFASVGINTYIDDIAREIKIDIEKDNTLKIDKNIRIEEKTYNVLGNYVKIRQKDSPDNPGSTVVDIVVDKKQKVRVNEIYVTGNTAIDAMSTTISKNYNHPALEWLDDNDKLILLTAHRRENLGDNMRNIFTAVKDIVDNTTNIKVIYPIHLNPKVREIANEIFKDTKKVKLIEPLDVFDFHNFMDKSYLILTDSGGIQEEAPSLGKPVLVLRDTTERPEGIDAGTLKLVGTNEKIIFFN